MSKIDFAFGRHWKRAWFLLVLGLATLVSACQNRADSAAATMISDDKMARILADLNIAEAATARLNGYPKDSLMHVYFQQVMEMHGVTVQAYEAQLRAIANDPARMENLLKGSENMLEDSLK